jgi:hypothetical protein
MPEITTTNPPPAQQKLDRQLLASLTLSPLAAGISTIVGFTVAHWVAAAGSKRMGYLVSASCFALCIAASLLAWPVRRKLGGPNETSPEDGRRLFMAKLALLLAGLCTLVVVAGTLVLITLRPTD